MTNVSPFRVSGYDIYNGGIDNHGYITITNDTYDIVSLKYYIDNMINNDIPWATYRISYIVGDIHIQSNTNRNRIHTAPLWLVKFHTITIKTTYYDINRGNLGNDTDNNDKNDYDYDKLLSSLEQYIDVVFIKTLTEKYIFGR